MLGLLSGTQGQPSCCQSWTALRQRGLSVEDAAEITGIDVERMRALVERREIERFTVEELADILDAVDASGPRYGRKL